MRGEGERRLDDSSFLALLLGAGSRSRQAAIAPSAPSLPTLGSRSGKATVLPSAFSLPAPGRESEREVPPGVRVIAGLARGTSLIAPPGLATRPTSDLMRGVIFNMLAAAGPFSRVVDLFAGSGALGIEAVSRGAKFATFVEQNPRACRVIQRNLEAARCTANAQVICASLPGAIDRLTGAYDLLLLDPPYEAGQIPAMLERLVASEHLSEGAIVVAEHRATTSLPDTLGDLAVWKRRRQGDSAVTMYRRGLSGLTV